jgi:hypothetical protein
MSKVLELIIIRQPVPRPRVDIPAHPLHIKDALGIDQLRTLQPHVVDVIIPPRVLAKRPQVHKWRAARAPPAQLVHDVR